MLWAAESTDYKRSSTPPSASQPASGWTTSKHLRLFMRTLASWSSRYACITKLQTFGVECRTTAGNSFSSSWKHTAIHRTGAMNFSHESQDVGAGPQPRAQVQSLTGVMSHFSKRFVWYQQLHFHDVTINIMYAINWMAL